MHTPIRTRIYRLMWVYLIVACALMAMYLWVDNHPNTLDCHRDFCPQLNTNPPYQED